MKTFFAWSLLGAGLFIQPALANDMTNAQQKVAMVAPQKCCIQCKSRSFRATGIVRKVDPENGIVIIFHAPVDDLMWPSMTMPFAVQDRDLLGRIKVGEKLSFEFVRDVRNGVIVGIK
ncbi:MAG: copper-binding protein [Gallionellaceae bacterium]